MGKVDCTYGGAGDAAMRSLKLSREPPLLEGVRSSTGDAVASLPNGLRIGSLESRDVAANEDVE